MAKTAEEKTAPVSDRQARWEAFLARYAEVNPTKYEEKKKNGEFDVIPDTF